MGNNSVKVEIFEVADPEPSPWQVEDAVHSDARKEWVLFQPEAKLARFEILFSTATAER